MVQGVDGLWYAYIADATHAQRADSTSTMDAVGLDFGTLCSSDNAEMIGLADADLADSTGFYSNADACLNHFDADGFTRRINVVREAKPPIADLGGQDNPTDSVGQIGLGEAGSFNPLMWPFIQLFDLTPGGDVVIEYSESLGKRTAILNYSPLDSAIAVESDRTHYSPGSEVHLTMFDSLLNIDPTDEDSWTFTFTPGAPQTRYGYFDENGNPALSAPDDIVSLLGTLMFGDNGRIAIDVNADNAMEDVLELNANNDNDPEYGPLVAAATASTITFVEQGPNSGVFGNYDEHDNANLDIRAEAHHGTSATIDYNGVSYPVFAASSTATLKFLPSDDEWNSGEIIDIILTDPDANRNSRDDEDLDLFNPNVESIPSVTIGRPFTLESLINVVYTDISANSQTDLFDLGDEEVQPFSHRVMLQNDGETTDLTWTSHNQTGMI